MKFSQTPIQSAQMHPFSNVSSFSKISKPQIRTNKLVNSVFYHPCPSRLASGMHPFHISLNTSGFYLSRMLAEFSLTCIFQHVQETFFNLWCLHSQKMHLIYVLLLMPQSPTQNSRQNLLKICFPQDGKGEGNYDLLYLNSIRKYRDDLEHQFIYISHDL